LQKFLHFANILQVTKHALNLYSLHVECLNVTWTCLPWPFTSDHHVHSKSPEDTQHHPTVPEQQTSCYTVMSNMMHYADIY